MCVYDVCVMCVYVFVMCVKRLMSDPYHVTLFPFLWYQNYVKMKVWWKYQNQKRKQKVNNNSCRAAAFGAGVLFLIASHLAKCDDMAFIYLFTHVLTHFFFTQGVSVSSSVRPSLPPEVLGFSLSLWFQMFWDWRCLGEEVISWQEACNSQCYNSLAFIPFFSFLSVYLWLQRVSWYFSLNCENSVFATSKHQGRRRGSRQIRRHVCVCVSISQGQGTMWPSIKCSLC